MISMLLNLVVHVAILKIMFDEDNGLMSLQLLRATAAMTSCILIIKIFDWFRLFEETAFYIRLLFVTLEDIGYFL